MASNITKNFKAKTNLRLAVGGVIAPQQPTPYDANQLQRGAAFQFGTTDPSGLGRGATAALQPSMSDTASQPYTPGGVGDPHATGASFAPTRTGLAPAMSRSRPVAPSLAPDPMKKGLRAGGVVEPEQSEVYEIDGPGDGSGVDDKTQVNVHGKKINVSKGERFAVFPAKVPAENIEEFIESQTGEPSATAGRGLRDGMEAFGGAVDDAGTLLEKLNRGNPVPVVDDFGNQVKPSAKSVIRGQQEFRAAAPQPAPTAPTAPTAPAAGSAATEAAADVGKKAALRGALSYAGPVATGVTTGLGVARYLDSFPSLRGKATASDSNAELAGTPQHQAVQNEERVAADDTWEQRHGKSLDAQHARVTTGAGAVLPQASYGNEGRRAVNSDIAVPSDQSRAEALAQGRNEIRANQLGLSAGQLDVLRKTTGVDTVPEGFSNGSWTSKNDVAGDYNDTLRSGNVQRLADGQGIASMRQKDGSYKNVTVDGNPVYTGADGKPTTSWYDTQAYKEAVSRAQQDKQTLRSMQQDRLMRDLGDDIKDPRVKAGAIAGLAAMNEQDKTAADKAYKAQGLRVQQAQLERDLRKDAQAQTNHEQTFSAGRDDKFKARVDTLINQMSTVDGKVDGTKAANLQKYAAQIPREIVRDEKTGKAREMDDNEYFDFLLDNFAVDQITGEAGTHLFTPEKDWQGERAQWKRTSPGLSRVLHGAPMQSVAYEDPLSKRVVYASDIEKLSPRQQAIFESRVNNPR